MNSRLCRSHSSYGRLGENKNILPLPGFKLRTVQPVTKCLYLCSQKFIICLFPKTGNQCKSSLRTYWRTIPILSSHLRLGHPRDVCFRFSNRSRVRKHLNPVHARGLTLTLLHLSLYNNIWYPILVAVLSKAWDCGRSVARIADWNPAEGMDVPRPRKRSLRQAQHPFTEVLPDVLL
jgi:hypothetical protein